MKMLPKTLLLGGSFALMLTALCVIFLYVPTEEVMGVGQRILYIHVPVCWLAFLAFFVTFLGSAVYLWRRANSWDTIAYSSAEIGIVFTTLALVTGSIWARCVWGVWWTWDARLTTTAVLWFIYLAYFIVRFSVTEEWRAARLAAVVGIVGFIDVPICALAIVLWRTHHPGPVIFEGGLTATMLMTLLLSLAAFTALYILLLWMRALLKDDEDEVKRLREVGWLTEGG